MLQNDNINVGYLLALCCVHVMVVPAVMAVCLTPPPIVQRNVSDDLNDEKLKMLLTVKSKKLK